MGGTWLGLTWDVVRNDLEGGRCLVELHIENRGEQPLSGLDWALYFNGVNTPEPNSTSAGARAEHVNGDLFRIVPTEEFSALPPGATWHVRYVGNAWALQRTDAIRGAYLVLGERTMSPRAVALGDPKRLPLSRPEQLNRSPVDVPTYDAERAFRDNQASRLLPESKVGKLTPAPHICEFTSQAFSIGVGTVIAHAPTLSIEAQHLSESLFAMTGLRLEVSTKSSESGITLDIDPTLAAPDGTACAEAYRLEVTNEAVSVRGASARGVFYALQSLLQLVAPWSGQKRASAWVIPGCRVEDAPRFAYRGLLLDVARNFSTKHTLLRVLDLMASYKLNKLHLHLTDDEGWRLEIPALPELTEVGACRGHQQGQQDCLPPSFGSGIHRDFPGTGFYSRADFLDILRYANQRHIHVIPEIDVPGHARAAIKSMEARRGRLLSSGRETEAERYLLTDFADLSVYKSAQGWGDNVICVGLESCYTFIETVACELKQMFMEAGAPLDAIHVGGDEMPAGCWENSPRCLELMARLGLASLRDLHDYFYERLREIFDRHGLTLAGWEEIALLPAAEHDVNVTPNPKFAKAGFLPYVWNTLTAEGSTVVREDLVNRLTGAGYEIVLCSVSHLYLDFAYVKHPEEPGSYWGGYIDARKVFDLTVTDERVRGIQGQLWGENLRSADDLEYLLLPRLVVLAERAWSRVEVEWNEFSNRLGRELVRLDTFQGGFAYRVPVPGAVLEGGLLLANLCTPGLSIHYTTDGSDPTTVSPSYQGPVAASRAKLATFTTTGRRSRIIAVSEPLSRREEQRDDHVHDRA